MADYNSSYTGEQIDTAVGKALSPDSTPTQNSTNLVQSGGVASAVSAVQNTVSRRNLLDNWYFVGGGSQQGGGQFPINQRGKTSYQTNGYTIDRWAFANTSICTPEPNGLRLNPNNQNNRQFIQAVENAQQYAGKTLTLSVMILENTASLLFFQVFGTVIDPGAGITGLYSTTITAPNTISDTSVKIRFNANYADTGNALISAIKLELGPIQTLAHQENGVWVLNEIPHFAEELAKCQRYFYNTGATSSAAIAINGLRGDAAAGKNMGAQVITPVVMRTTPTVDATMSSIRGNGSIWNSNLSVSNTPLAVFGNLVILDVQCSTASFPAYTNGYAVLFSKLQLSADL